jgi:HEAT repeat protein
MLSRQKRLSMAAAAILIVCATVSWLRHRHPHHAALPGEADDHAAPRDRWRGFEAGVDVPRPPADAGAAAARPDPFSREVTPEQVSGAMTEWRQAIIEKRKDPVIALDRAFSMLPGRYGPALLELAKTDPDERVRAFSTRVLGKMRNTALVEDYQRLLADKSPFVRQNAAWALGELALRPGGREAALAALDELRQAQDDPATEVRAAATNALKALQ